MWLMVVSVMPPNSEKNLASTYIVKFIARIHVNKQKKPRHAKLSLCSAVDSQLEWVYHDIDQTISLHGLPTNAYIGQEKIINF